MKRLALIAALLLPLSAQAFSLGWPLACSLGKNCFVQNYVDRQPGPGMTDYTCGASVYEEGHDGTDIRLKSLADMRAGVDVLAAAAGTVKATRDNVEDKMGHGEHSPEHQDCGNAVIITHADGYETTYCHMRLGSIAVKPGEQVAAGQKIGQVGLSGFTDFPHLHFGVRHDGVFVDPFDGATAATPCHVSSPAPLWQRPPDYAPTALLGDGFAGVVPDKDAMRDAPVALTSAPNDLPVLSYWMDIMGTRAGDLIVTRITGPNGDTFVEYSGKLEKSSAFFFSYIGKRTHGQLAPGIYRASLKLERDGRTIVGSERQMTVN